MVERRDLRTHSSLTVVLAICLASVAAALALPHATGAEYTAAGWTTDVTAPASVVAGGEASLTVHVTAGTSGAALVDLEVYGPRGRKVFQEFWDNQSFTAGRQRSFTAKWSVPADLAEGEYTVKVAMFGPGWSGLRHWNDTAGAIAVTVPSTEGWTTSATATASVVSGDDVSLTAHVAATNSGRALVDLEVRGPGGHKVFQEVWDDESFTAGRQRSFSADWSIPANGAPGQYVVKIGIFGPGWNGLWHWNDAAAVITMSSGAPSPADRFDTLPPGSALPTSEECASRVRPAPEVRAVNVPYNGERGYSFTPDYHHATVELSRVDGNFTGTTDEVLQWAACKWGIDEDVVRAQMAKESWWDQRNKGDWWSYPPEECPPGHALGEDGRTGECPQSLGIGQTRYYAGNQAFPGVEHSTAMNVDYTYAIWRACFEGKETWLNDVERGRQYGAGDLWGCVGRWFAGRWYTQRANSYIDAVQDYFSRRIWTTPEFLGY